VGVQFLHTPPIASSPRRVARTLRHAALGLTLAALAAAALAGAFAPAASAAPDAPTIDAFLTAHGSPMAGNGAAFVAAGEQYGVDPAFLVAISGAETSFGQLLYSKNGDECTYNAFNWFFGPTWPRSDFSSWSEGISRVAQGLAGPMYYGAGLYSVDAIAPRYCPDGTANWVSNVTAFLTALGGNPADTRLFAPTATPPSVQPGLVALEGSVWLGRGPYEVGRHIDVGFTITNSGGQSLTLDGIRLAVRGPGGASADMVSRHPVTIAPGESRAVTAAIPLTMRGRWSGWIEVAQNGASSLVGKSQAFSFHVKLPRDPRVRRWVVRESSLSVKQ
jgi:hypothetical protein